MSDGSLPDIKMLTLAEVAERFSVTPYTVREWIRNGVIKSSKISGRHYIAADEVVRVAQAKYGEAQ